MVNIRQQHGQGQYKTADKMHGTMTQNKICSLMNNSLSNSKVKTKFCEGVMYLSKRR